MGCEVCNDRGWILVCQNCGHEANISFIGDDLYESCKECSMNGLDYEIIQIPCKNCQNQIKNSSSSFKLSCNEIIKEYSKEYGEKKLRKIQQEIAQSLKFKNSIQALEEKKSIPSINGIISLIGSHVYFMFGPKRNIALASCLFLYLWHQRCNSNYKLLS
ncbi:MAG: hypothetical protein ACM3RX_04470, partial [Methanococcaceae archaeon]